jgi:hypothetical protein
MNCAASFVSLDHVKRAREILKEEGLLLIEDGFSEDACAKITQWIDGYEDIEGAEMNYGNTELRIWDSENEHDLIEDFFDACNIFVSCLEKEDREADTILAIRNRPLSKDRLDLHEGRWHLDSFRRQIKIFLFLDDVDLGSGPFEVIPGTQSTAFKLRLLASGKLIRPRDIFAGGGARQYQSINDEWLSKMLETTGYEPHKVCCKRGTVAVVDTSAMHRASPCYEKTRYALTAYYS